MGNSIFTVRQGEALPYSTQSRETITREGGRGGGGLSGNKAEVSFLLLAHKLKEEHKAFSVHIEWYFSLSRCEDDHSAKIPAMTPTEKWYLH